MSRAKLKAFEDFFNKSPLGCSLCDMEGTFLRVNHAFSDLIGFSILDTLRLSYRNIIPKEYEHEEMIVRQELSERGTSRPHERLFLHREGFHVPVLVSSWVAESDGEKFILSVAEPREDRRMIAPKPPVGREVRDRSSDLEWSDARNARRCELIDRKIQDTISTDEAAELEDLQEALRAHLDEVAPLPMEGAKKLHAELIRRNVSSFLAG
jgi:PAS domain S-box-containing protein